MEILNGIYGVKFRNMVSAMPDKNIALGGKLCLRGNFVSLTCFHGVNFRSQNWGLFTLRGPCIEFTTHNKAFEKSCQVMRGQSSQNLTFTLGDTTPDSLSERRRSTSNLHGRFHFLVDQFLLTYFIWVFSILFLHFSLI